MYYDLHIHSCLSPCAEEEMTPNNICAMAALKGLDVISVTDHNSARNLRALAVCAAQRGLLFLPGIEFCTREEVHLLGYFAAVQQAEEAARQAAAFLPPVKNQPAFYGSQWVMDAQDAVVAHEEALLIGALALDFSALCQLVRRHGGVPVPAHVWRGNGVIRTLGFIPPQDRLTCLEAGGEGPLPPGYHVLHSSDAHRLGDLAEPGPLLPQVGGTQAILDWMSAAVQPAKPCQP